MAIYRMNTSHGHIGSASPHSDYIRGEGKYSYKQNEIAYENNFMPEGITPREFWKCADENEPVIGKRESRTYREFKLTLPHELSLEENIKLVNEFIEKEIGKNHYYSVVIHDKESSEKGIKNVHAHLMFSERTIDGIERPLEKYFQYANWRNPANGGAKKDEIWGKKYKLLQIRQSWEDVLNKHLEAKGIEKVSCKSLKAQKEEALENGDFEKAKFLDREPINIPGYLLKKDKDKMSINELDQYNDYLVNKDIYNKGKELYLNSQKAKKQYGLYNEIENNINDLTYNLQKDNYTFDDFSNVEANFNMLEREIYKTRFMLQEENLEREVYKINAPEHYNLLIERDNLIDRYEQNKNRNIEVSSEEFYKNLAEITAKINSSFENLKLDNFLETKNEIKNNLEKSLERYMVNQERFKVELDKIKEKIGEEKFDKSLLKKEFNSNLERMIECKFEIKQLNRKLNSYNRNLDKEKLHESAMNIYSKGEYYRISNNYKNLRNRLEILEPNVIYKTGSSPQENEKMKKEYKILKEKYLTAKKELETFQEKYSNKNVQIKIAHITESMEKKYRGLIEKALLDKKLLSVELNLVRNRINETPINKKETYKTLEKYSIKANLSKVNLEKKENIIKNLKNSFTKEKISNTALNKLSKGRYFIVAKEYKVIADRFESLNKKEKNLKFYEIKKKLEIKKEKKDLVSKMEDLETEYNGILALKNKNEFKNTVEEIKSLGSSLISSLKEELKQIKNEVYENNDKNFIASGIKNEIEYISKDEKQNSNYKPYYDNSNIGSGIGMEDDEDENGGGGGFQILDKDENRWKKKQKNVFEQGFSL